KWETPFDINDTKLRPFYNNGNIYESSQVLMMRNDFTNLKVAQFESENEQFTIIQLPYKDEFLMFMVKPNKLGVDLGKVKLILFDALLIGEEILQFQKKKVILSIPKFQFSQSYNLEKILNVFGIDKLDLIDFGNMFQIDNGMSTSIDIKGKHFAIIDIDEIGTEAAAVSYTCADGGEFDTIEFNNPNAINA
ncbi:Protein Z-dependent protease inhibitor-like protein, partial [Dinothrombium tinctorium]